jgi:hypothetical protein
MVGLVIGSLDVIKTRHLEVRRQMRKPTPSRLRDSLPPYVNGIVALGRKL